MNNENKYIKGFLPPYFIEFVKRIIRIFKKDELFEGNDYLFKQYTNKTKIYGEYGCGQSTIWMAKNTNAIIYSVDTSLEWSKKVKNATNNNKNIFIEVIDCGELENYGYPKNYSKRDNFDNYFKSIWKSQKNKPDTVLIDGRFRVACFLTSLLYADPGTVIIFDDYVNRPNYHIVEEYLKPIKTSGRQALFIRPSLEKTSFKVDKLKKEILNFYNVLD